MLTRKSQPRAGFQENFRYVVWFQYLNVLILFLWSNPHLSCFAASCLQLCCM
jgi:hypothetical protein